MAAIGPFHLFSATGIDMPVAQDPVLIVASLAVSMVGCWRFLYLTVNMREGKFRTDESLAERYCASMLYGFCGVWSLHFLAINAYVFPEDVTLYFNVPLMILSAIFPVLAACLATIVIKRNETTPRPVMTVFLASLIMTLGIALMHYIGFASFSGVLHLHTLPSILFTAVAAFGMNIVSCWCLMRLPTRQSFKLGWFIITAIALSMGVVFPHFTSQCTVGFLYDTDASQPSLSLKGGAHSDIQTLVIVVNFFMGTVVANFFNMRDNVLADPGVSGTDMLAKLSMASKASDKRAASLKSVKSSSGGLSNAGASREGLSVLLQDAGTQTDLPDVLGQLGADKQGNAEFSRDVRSI